LNFRWQVATNICVCVVTLWACLAVLISLYICREQACSLRSIAILCVTLTDLYHVKTTSLSCSSWLILFLFQCCFRCTKAAIPPPWVEQGLLAANGLDIRVDPRTLLVPIFTCPCRAGPVFRLDQTKLPHVKRIHQIEV